MAIFNIEIFSVPCYNMCIHFKGTVKINIMKKLVITPLESQKDGRLLFLTCFIFYTLINTGRLNYSAAASEITLSGFMLVIILVK